MNAPFPNPNGLPALGGGVLAGSRIVQLVYVDESGISNPSHEPYLIVASVIINPDERWHRIAVYYREMAEDVFEGNVPYRFVFHAMDVWHGKGFFSREKWSLVDRMKIMRRLIQVPSLFAIPVCLGVVRRDESDINIRKAYPEMNPRDRRSFIHARAFHMSMQLVDWWITKNRPNEVAMVVAEDNPEVRETLRWFHRSAQTHSVDGHESVFQTSRIVDALSFASKHDSPILQVADTCAFVTRRAMSKCRHATPMFLELTGNIVQSDQGLRDIQLILRDDYDFYLAK